MVYEILNTAELTQYYSMEDRPGTNMRSGGGQQYAWLDDEEIISQLNAIPNVRPRGRPLGFTVADDGSIWILDDINKALLRVAKGESYKLPDKPDTGDVSDLLTNVDDNKAAEVLLTRCQVCHGLPTTAAKMEIPSTWLVLQDGKRVIEQRLFHSPLRPMPPDAPLTSLQRAALETWLKDL